MKYNFRSTFAQIFATSTKNLLLFSSGMFVGMSQLIAGVTHNAESGISLDNTQVALLTSIQFFCTPLVSPISGVLIQRYGRKIPMMALTAMSLSIWLLLVFATSPGYILGAAVLAGVYSGMVDAPTRTYAGEVCEPHLRGALTSTAILFFVLGKGLIPILGWFLHWQTVSLVCLAIPTLGFFALSMIPESPYSLAARGKMAEATESLRWLRGWTTAAKVEEEMQTISRCCTGKSLQPLTEDASSDSEENDNDEGCMSSLRQYTKPESVGPFLLVGIYFILGNLSYGAAMGPYIMRVNNLLNIDYNVYIIAAVHNSMGIVTTFLVMIVVSVFGKRRISLVSASGLTLAHAVTALHATFPALFPTWVPVTSMFVSTFVFNMGMVAVPWIMLSEVFPFKTRPVLSGLAVSCEHLQIFLVFSTYLPLENAIGIDGIFWMQSASALVALVFFFICLPETEGRSLQQIEHFFSQGRLPSRKEKNVLRSRTTSYSSPC